MVVNIVMVVIVLMVMTAMATTIDGNDKGDDNGVDCYDDVDINQNRHPSAIHDVNLHAHLPPPFL